MADVNVNAGIKLKEGAKYMRHTPSGRIYPFEEAGARLDTVEIFVYHQKGNQKIVKPTKAKPKGPFQREQAVGAFDTPADKVLNTTDNLAASE